MKPDENASARDKILFYLKTRGPQTAASVASRLEVTAMAVRQHLYELERDGMVAHEDQRRSVGRPARFWLVTPKAAARFPDSHAELLVDLIQAARAAYGDKGLNALVAQRTRQQIANYRGRMPDGGTLEKRVAALAALRRQEGYMAEWSRQKDGTLLLVENHCPICAAAQSCQSLCGGEMDLFRALLGKNATIERTEHIVAGARRCAYRIS